MLDPTQIIHKKSEELRELELFAGVCRSALNQATRSVEAIDLRRRIAEVLNEKQDYESESQLNTAKQHALKVSEFAEGQRKDGLPYLHSLCAVRLWALTEAMVDELVVHSLLTPSECFDQALLSRLKGPLIEFRSASPDEQAEFLAETLKQLVDAPLKLGAGKFEALLAPVGLGGEIQEGVRRTLYELSQIRNIIVHKSGKADRRIVEACPWLNYKKGDTVHVTFKMFECYRLAVYWYIVAIRGRVDSRDGIKNVADLNEILQMIEGKLEFASTNTNRCDD
ncbi:hypothetical protein [Pseudomonas chlororaphis]|jgi:hypothetical protein|uniref:hypothetical protein n=1 Tax=Pseudomonas chlororaphis TaxID=587753 RepID=UPI0007BB484A|nr:hypothetical protein [Pseudomonas chlororaphis]AZC62628.1 hypothetical protein C4K33_2136 [Pseudomonas chlororaphis subsp. piscium]KZO48970.1 hypothetical protein PCL1391_1925 [Pseudomonas chlororaphis subsp. piscium]MBP5066822.1 hypothetical protein [Pseudomonas chlororaphis]